MIRRCQWMLLMAMTILASVCLPAQDSQRWVFEGLVTEAASQLAPHLQSGWVLSGSYVYSSLLMEQEIVEAEVRSGRMAGGVSKGELTIDLYHQVLFTATQVPGLAGFDYQDNHPDHDGRDLLGWFFPIEGMLADTGWNSRWLQIWLMDREGDMIPGLPVQISPYEIDWKTGWFRITFENDKGESVFVDGRIELFAPEAQLEDRDSAIEWRGIAADLGAQLRDRDTTIQGLREELMAVQERLDGARRMVDLLVEERSGLQEENALLKERAAQADPEGVAQLAELTADKVMLQEKIGQLTDRNTALALQLASSEETQQELLQQLAELKASQPVPEPVSDLQTQPVVVEALPEAPKVINDPVSGPVEPVLREPITSDTDTLEQVIETTKPDESPESKNKLGPKRFGPRKFR